MALIRSPRSPAFRKKICAKIRWDRRRRRLLLEELESRLVLASNWQNPFVARDVSGDGIVVAQDALIIINELNQHTVSLANGALPSRSLHPQAPYWSTDGDEFVAPLDVLL